MNSSVMVEPKIDFGETHKEERPWGSFIVLGKNIVSTVKVISVDPNEEISLQYHSHRLEHWVIVNGEGVVTIGEHQYNAFVGKEFVIRKNVKHRIKAGGKGVILVEFCPGKNFDEEDNNRIHDKYGRV